MCFSKQFAVKLWSLISRKSTLPKITDTKLCEPYRKKTFHLRGWKYLYTFFFMWTLISPSKKIWVFWGLAKDSLSLCIWKYFLIVSRHLPKIYTTKHIFVMLFLILLLNGDLWAISNRFLQKQKNLRFLRPNKRNP